MGWIVDHYKITYNDLFVGSYYVYEDNTCRYYVNSWKNELEPIKDLLEKKGLLKDKDTKRPIAAITKMMTAENRVKGRKRSIYHCDGLTLERIPNETNERFLVYRHDANKGQPGYSDKDHSAPHYEGEKTPEGMREWTTWYAFVKMDDGTYEAALDESWWWGGGHNDGGTIHTDIPEERKARTERILWFQIRHNTLFPPSFQFQQRDFVVYASSIAREVAISSHHAMAGHDETNGVPSHCATYRLCRIDFQPFCDFSIS